jgi:hypothetical protein
MLRDLCQQAHNIDHHVNNFFISFHNQLIHHHVATQQDSNMINSNYKLVSGAKRNAEHDQNETTALQ